MARHGRAAALSDAERAELLQQLPPTVSADDALSVSERSADAQTQQHSARSGKALRSDPGHVSRASELSEHDDDAVGGSNEGSIVDELSSEMTLRKQIRALRLVLDVSETDTLDAASWPNVNPLLLRELCDATEAQLDSPAVNASEAAAPVRLLDDIERMARALYDAAHDLIWHQQFTFDLVASASFWRELATAALIALAQEET